MNQECAGMYASWDPVLPGLCPIAAWGWLILLARCYWRAFASPSTRLLDLSFTLPPGFVLSHQSIPPYIILPLLDIPQHLYRYFILSARKPLLSAFLPITAVSGFPYLLLQTPLFGYRLKNHPRPPDPNSIYPVNTSCRHSFTPAINSIIILRPCITTLNLITIMDVLAELLVYLPPTATIVSKSRRKRWSQRRIPALRHSVQDSKLVVRSTSTTISSSAQTY